MRSVFRCAPSAGERVSGDSAAHFETEDGTLCLLLSDGMGCGEAAQRESSMAARLLERFLRAGIDAPPALKTLNSALSLRAESTGQLYDGRPADAFRFRRSRASSTSTARRRAI